jgi:hypothetical protein
MLGPQIARVEDIETVKTDLVEAQWKPVRNHFGITGFGTNAYLARASGDVLIEDHAELRSGFEELYVVLRGQVEFTLEVERGRDERVSLCAAGMWSGGTRRDGRRGGARRGRRAHQGVQHLRVGDRAVAMKATCRPWPRYATRSPRSSS